VPRSGAARAIFGRIISKVGKLATPASRGRSHDRSGWRRPPSIDYYVRLMMAFKTRGASVRDENPNHFLTTWELGLPPRQRRLFGQPDEPTLVKPDEHARLQGQKLS